MSTSEKPSIAIVGGGLGGLTLASILLHQRPPFPATVTVYERDASADARAHLGGTLDLHAESGVAALKACGLFDEYKSRSRPEGEATMVTDKTGVPLYEETPPEGRAGGRPEIDRTVLRNMLLDAIPAECVKWDHALVSATPLPSSSGHEIVFANGYKTQCTLLVGADGARSRVRPLLSDAQPSYTGITGAEISLPPNSAPELAQRVGNGTMFALDSPGMAIISQMNGDGRIRTYALVKSDDPHAFSSRAAVESGGQASTGDAEAEAEEVLRKLTETFSDWAPWMRELIARADRSAVYPRALYVLPVDHAWAHKPGVTLLGDAANLMSPFAGEGANTAMRSAMELAQALIATTARGGIGSWDDGVREYERRRVKYASAAARESAEHLEQAFNDGAAETYAAFFKSHSSVLGMAGFALAAAGRWLFG